MTTAQHHESQSPSSEERLTSSSQRISRLLWATSPRCPCSACSLHRPTLASCSPSSSAVPLKHQVRTSVVTMATGHTHHDKLNVHSHLLVVISFQMEAGQLEKCISLKETQWTHWPMYLLVRYSSGLQECLRSRIRRDGQKLQSMVVLKFCFFVFSITNSLLIERKCTVQGKNVGSTHHIWTCTLTFALLKQFLTTAGTWTSSSRENHPNKPIWLGETHTSLGHTLLPSLQHCF